MLIPGRLDDPRVDNVVVTGVESSPDLSTVRVFYVAPGDPKDVVAEALGHAAGFVRGELGSLGLRRLPVLTFTYDHGYESGQRVLELLGDMPHAPEDGQEDDPDSGSAQRNPDTRPRRPDDADGE